MHLVSLLIRLTVLAALLWLAVIDVRERRLPTRIVLVIGALFFADAIVLRLPASGLLIHSALALGAFAICALLFAVRMLGGGDAKLAAVVFLWTGPDLALPALTLISLIGTLIAFISLATRSMDAYQTSSWKRALAMFSSIRGVPYGLALSLGGGTVIVLPALLSLSPMQ